MNKKELRKLSHETNATIWVGKDGVEKVIELYLTKEEKINFDLSISAVKELFQSAIKIDSDLGK